MMTAQLFPDLPEQREGPIEVDGRKLATCPDCYGDGLGGTAHCGGDQDGDRCRRCNGGGLVLVLVRA